MMTPTRHALMGKSIPDLTHMLRLMGADSQPGESKDSIVSRILLFQRQKWEPKKKIERKPVVPVSEEDLHKALMPYKLRGLDVEVRGGCWHVEIQNRKESGNLCMPLNAIERTVRYLMPKEA